MRILLSFFLCCFYFLIQANVTHAFQLSPQSEISLLTCSPGNEAYSVYGHSAFRIKDEVADYDVVFNYGLFDFSTPNFVYRFARGQTDYLLGAYDFSHFLNEYISDKRSIYEQVINLTHTEKQNVFDFLLWNARPENRVYRYNFFFDNCATRIRDVIQEQVNGEVVFPEYVQESKTFRELIKDYHSKMLWLNFGIDLVVAAPSDREASAWEEMFLPDYLMLHFSNTTINDSDSIRSLVQASHQIYKAPEVKYRSIKVLSPTVVLSILLLIVIIITIKHFWTTSGSHTVDYLVFGINGFIGLAILWFTLYSEHPAMSPNYNLMWAVPLNLFFALIWKVKKWRAVTRHYFTVVAVWMSLFLLISFLLPQKFHVGFYILSLMVLCRAVINSYRIFIPGNK